MQLKQQKDISFYQTQVNYLEDFINNPDNITLVAEMHIKDRLKSVKALHEKVKSDNYLDSLVGTIGADPLFKKD